MKREANLDPPAYATQRLGNFRDREQRVRAFFVCEDKEEETGGLWIYSLKLLQLPSFFQLSQMVLSHIPPGILPRNPRLAQSSVILCGLPFPWHRILALHALPRCLLLRLG